MYSLPNLKPARLNVRPEGETTGSSTEAGTSTRTRETSSCSGGGGKRTTHVVATKMDELVIVLSDT